MAEALHVVRFRASWQPPITIIALSSTAATIEYALAVFSLSTRFHVSVATLYMLTPTTPLKVLSLLPTISGGICKEGQWYEHEEVNATSSKLWQ